MLRNLKSQKTNKINLEICYPIAPLCNALPLDNSISPKLATLSHFANFFAYFLDVVFIAISQLINQDLLFSKLLESRYLYSC